MFTSAEAGRHWEEGLGPGRAGTARSPPACILPPGGASLSDAFAQCWGFRFLFLGGSIPAPGSPFSSSCRFLSTCGGWRGGAHLSAVSPFPHLRGSLSPHSPREKVRFVALSTWDSKWGGPFSNLEYLGRVGGFSWRERDHRLSHECSLPQLQARGPSSCPALPTPSPPSFLAASSGRRKLPTGSPLGRCLGRN